MRLFNLIKKIFGQKETKKILEKKERTPINRNTTRFIRYPNENPLEDIIKRQKKISENPRTGLPFLIKKKP